MSDQGSTENGIDGEDAAVNHVRHSVPSSIPSDKVAMLDPSTQDGTNDLAASDVNTGITNGFSHRHPSNVRQAYPQVESGPKYSNFTQGQARPLTPTAESVGRSTMFMHRETIYGDLRIVEDYRVIVIGASSEQHGAVENTHTNDQDVDTEHGVSAPPLHNGYRTLASRDRESELFSGPRGTSVSPARGAHTSSIVERLNSLSAAIGGRDNDGNDHDVAEAARIAASTEHAASPHPVGLAGGYDSHAYRNGTGEPSPTSDNGQPLSVARRPAVLGPDQLTYYARREAAGGNVEPSSEEVQQPSGRELQEPASSESTVRHRRA